MVKASEQRHVFNCGWAYGRVEVKASEQRHVFNYGWAYGRVEVKASAPPHVLRLWLGVWKGGG